MKSFCGLELRPGRSVRRGAAALLLSVPMVACAEIRLPSLLTEHALLQRGVPVRVWGWATPGAALTVKLHGQSVTATADRLGEWTAWLAPESGGGPYTLTIAGGGDEGTKTVEDVLVGDVWLASGQSNMEMPLAGFPPGASIKDGPKEIAAATNPQLRLFLVEHKTSDFPLEDVAGHWTLCTPETAAKFSAVGYFFGREIAAKERVAVGLIDSTWGGTPADAWVSMGTLGSDPALLPAFASRARFAATKLTRAEAMMAAEKREDAEAKAAGRPAPQHDWHPFGASWMPAALYNGMIAPLTPYSIKGFLWYQGETNSSGDRAPHYATLFQALIRDWRQQFGQGELPFLYAQISSFNSPGEHWGVIRDAQRRALQLRGTAMAVTTDVGDPGNVHPADKQTVGARLALAARHEVYGEAVASEPPLFREATRTPEGMRVWFEHGEGLTSRGQAVAGFEVAGADGRFVPAEARLEGGTAVVSSAAVKDPRQVRYGWTNVLPGAIYNAAGLPMSTFTTEEAPQQ